MGKIVESILNVKEKFRELWELIDGLDTRPMQWDLIHKVVSYFSRFYPLSYDTVLLGKEASTFGSWDILMGRWFMRKAEWYRRALTLDTQYTFEAMRIFHSQIRENVRKAIREDVNTFLDALCQVKDYKAVEVKASAEELGVRPKITYCVMLRNEIHQAELRFDMIRFRSHEPRVIAFLNREGELLQTMPLYGFSMEQAALEDLLDPLISMLTRVRKEIDEARRHNEPLLKLMDDCSKVWKISKMFK